MCVCACAHVCMYVLFVTPSCHYLGDSSPAGVQGGGASQCDSELVVSSPLTG